MPKKMAGPAPGPATTQTIASNPNADRATGSGTLAPQYTHLYYLRWVCWQDCRPEPHDCYELAACPVTRVTAKRIYFRGADNGAKWLREREWFVSRREIEGTGNPVGQLLAGGGVYHRALRQVLHLTPPERPTLGQQLRKFIESEGAEQKSVAELRKEAADLHPDRGGDPEAFRIAYARYTHAKAATR